MALEVFLLSFWWDGPCIFGNLIYSSFFCGH